MNWSTALYFSSCQSEEQIHDLIQLMIFLRLEHLVQATTSIGESAMDHWDRIAGVEVCNKNFLKHRYYCSNAQ